MAVAEDKSWEYTLGRMDERTENLERGMNERFEHGEADIKDIRKTLNEKMLTKTTFFAFLSGVAGLLAAMIGLK